MKTKLKEVLIMERYCIAISREYGSGGRLIGKKLAEDLGVKFYDRELISLIAKETGFDEGYVEAASETAGSPFMYGIYGYANMPVADQIYLAESKVILDLVEKETFVIIGRNAAGVLADNKSAMSMFIHAPLEYRVNFVKENYNVESEKINKEIARVDKRRDDYIRCYSGRGWKDMSNYDLSINSSIGVDASVEVIKKYVEGFMKKQ